MKLYAEKKFTQIREKVLCSNLKEGIFTYRKCRLVPFLANFFREDQASVISHLQMKGELPHMSLKHIGQKSSLFSESFLSFCSLDKEKAPLVKSWLQQDYVAKYWYGIGLEKTLKTIDRFVKGEEPLYKLWIAKYQNASFGFLMTSPVDIAQKRSIFFRFCNSNTIAITLDLLIGEPPFLGKGLSVPMIQQLLVQKYPDVTDVFIDPSLSNPSAVYVYKKVGFKPVDTFVPDWCPTEHILMQLKMNKLKKSLQEQG